MVLLEIADLEVRYGSALVLDAISLNVEAGQLVGVLGPNGAGKSTLLKAISRTVSPASGRIVFNGLPLDGSRPTRWSVAAFAIAPRGGACFRNSACSRI